MREVKFRGKQENGQWVYGDNFAICHDCYIRVKIKDEFNPSQWVKVDYKTVGQYTGIKDKNGVEIYEGDILRYSNAMVKDIIRSVVFKWGGFGIDGTLPGTFIYFGHILESDIEKIGNIYENSDILSVNNDCKESE